MTTFLILALCVAVLWAGSKALNHLTKSDRRTIESRAPPSAWWGVLPTFDPPPVTEIALHNVR
jgi:hypothetical protein